MEIFAERYKKAPAKIEIGDIKEYQRYLITDKGYAANTVHRHMSALRFFYCYVLERPWYREAIPLIKRPKKMPTVLSESEIALLIDSVHKLLYKAVIMTTYSAGLRLSEVRNLKLRDIDSERMVIHVKNGKGSRDREALLSPVTLKCLRTYFRLYRGKGGVKSQWLFTPTKNSLNGNLDKKLSHTAIGYMLDTAAKAARIKKKLPLMY